MPIITALFTAVFVQEKTVRDISEAQDMGEMQMMNVECDYSDLTNKFKLIFPTIM